MKIANMRPFNESIFKELWEEKDLGLRVSILNQGCHWIVKSKNYNTSLQFGEKTIDVILEKDVLDNYAYWGSIKFTNVKDYLVKNFDISKYWSYCHFKDDIFQVANVSIIDFLNVNLTSISWC